MINKKIEQKFLLVGNWKANPETLKAAQKLFRAVVKPVSALSAVETVVCPPTIYLGLLKEDVVNRNCVLGAQTVSSFGAGSHTGSTTVPMLFDSKVRYVLVGHSEERAAGVTLQDIQTRISHILKYPLSPIICVGETVRDSKNVFLKKFREEVKKILSGIPVEHITRVVFAYEPVWAIGENAPRPATPLECAQMIGIIRQSIRDQFPELLELPRVIYGASVSLETVKGFIEGGHADGLLPGRASLDAKQFVAIARMLQKLKKK